jgi:hypothetical protein
MTVALQSEDARKASDDFDQHRADVQQRLLKEALEEEERLSMLPNSLLFFRSGRLTSIHLHFKLYCTDNIVESTDIPSRQYLGICVTIDFFFQKRK